MVVSHERSGTHFLINALGEAYGYPNAQFVMFDEPALAINYFDPAVVAQTITAIAAQRRGSVIKSHHAAEFFQGTLPRVTRDVMIFYVYRHPADVMISFWRFMHRWTWREGPRLPGALAFAMAEPEGHMLRYQMRQRSSMLERWAAHVDTWMEAAATNRRIVPVRFEDLRDSYVATIGGLSALIGRPPRSVQPPDPNRYVIKGAPPESLEQPDRDAIARLAKREVGGTMRRFGYL